MLRREMLVPQLLFHKLSVFPVTEKEAHEKLSDYLAIQIPNKDVKQL